MIIECDKCQHQFAMKVDNIKQEKIIIKGLKYNFIYRQCPNCNAIYKIFIEDKKIELLQKELEDIREQINKNHGTFNFLRAEILAGKLNNKKAEIEVHSLKLNERLKGEFILKNGKIEYIEEK